MKRWHAVFLLTAAVCAAMGLILCREPAVLPASFRRDGTDEIRDFRLTYSWPPEQDGPLIRSEKNIRPT